MTIVCTFLSSSAHPMDLQRLQGFTGHTSGRGAVPGHFVSYTIAFHPQKLERVFQASSAKNETGTAPFA